jgi:signal transduction histidine kinase/predicted metal-dependent HD superfamily phosphohydrolase
MSNERHRGGEVAQVEALVRALQSRPIIARILERLRRELPTNLLYHAVGHTEDVLAEAMLFCHYGQVSQQELELLAIAAAYHDAGYLERYVDNEVIGARMARAAMEEEGYALEQISAVERMVLDTRLVSSGGGRRQVATSGLSRFLLDADLSNFGRPDFFEKSELQRLELGVDRERFLRRTFALVATHTWQTEAARRLRQPTKEENLRKLSRLLEQSIEIMTEAHREMHISTERLASLARLPLLLNSSLDTHMVLTVALRHLKEVLSAEAATIFLLNEARTELSFWALEGGANAELQGRSMSATKGIVGWVIEKQEGILVRDVQADPRFFSEIDRAGGFTTRSLMCVPLTVRGDFTIGALQVLNPRDGAAFEEHDLMFLEQFGHQAALALDNAALFERATQRAVALEQIDRQRADALALLAHELRTPLNVIQTSAELLSGQFQVDERVRRTMGETLQRGVARLARVVVDVKVAAHVAWNGGLEEENAPTPVNIGELLGDIAAFFEPICQAQGLALTVRGCDVSAHVRGDRGLLLVALKNLVSNGVRFTRPGGHLEVGAEIRAGLAEFSVRDTGIGIAPEHRLAIFEKFFEVKDVLHHSSGDYRFGSAGLGLGLSTARGIVRAHGGSLEVESELEKGSRFFFRLPIVDS